MPDYPVHPLAEAFPMLPEEELEALTKSVKRYGLQDAIPVCQRKDHGGVTTRLDGRNRLEACQRAGIEPRYDDLGLMTEKQIAVFVNNANLRRNLTKGQLAIVVAIQYPDGGKGGRNPDPAKATIEALSVSHSRLTRARFILDKAPELALAIRDNPTEEKFSKAYEKLVQAQRSLNAQQKTMEEALRILRDKDPDLAEEVEEDQLTLKEAQDILQEREEAAEDEESQEDGDSEEESQDDGEEEFVPPQPEPESMINVSQRWEAIAGESLRNAKTAAEKAAAVCEDIDQYQERFGELPIEFIDALLRYAILTHEAWLGVANKIRGHTKQTRHLSVVPTE